MVVDGEFVVYLDIYEDLDPTLVAFLDELMNVQHALDDAHPYIRKVRYVSLSSETVPGSVEGETQVLPPGSNSSTLSSSVYALIAAGGFLIVGTAIFYRRRRRNAAEEDGGDTTTLGNTVQS